MNVVCFGQNSEIDIEEFKKVMTLMRKQNRQGAHHRDGRRLGMKVSVENGGLVEYFFGQDGKDSLRHDKFVQFLRQLHDEVLYSHTIRTIQSEHLNLASLRKVKNTKLQI